MKFLCSLFLAPALALAAPAVHAQETGLEPIESKLDAAVLVLKTKVFEGQDPFDALGEVWALVGERNQAAEPIFPRAGSARYRLQSVIDELVGRAARWQLYFEDIEQFVEEVVEARMEEELAALDELVANGEMTSRLRYEHAVSLIHRIAARTLQITQAPELRPRLAALIADLFAAADLNTFGMVHVKSLGAFIAYERVDRSLRRNKRRAAAGVLAPFDVVLHEQRVKALAPYGIPPPMGTVD
jgi:hypothetical protein